LLALLAVLAAGAPLGAQSTVRLGAETTLHKDPGGVRLFSLNRNTPVAVVRTRGNWTEVTLEAWIWSRSVGATTREGFNLVVTAQEGENIRAQPDGAILGRAVTGALLDRVRTQGGWTRVRRTGWVASSAVPRVSPPAAPAPAPAPAPPPAARSDSAASPAPAGPESALPATGLVKGTSLSVVPGGTAFAELTGPADARVTGRQGDWVRVRLEGWVRAADLADPRDADVARITAADLRREPDRYVGEVVDWRLQFLAVQVAGSCMSS